MTKKTLPIHKNCQSCLEAKESTRTREIYTAKYMGPCGDSFCYAGCDSETCRPVRASVCDECAAKLAGDRK